VIRTDREEPPERRLAELYRDLLGVLEEHRPSVVALERVFTNRNRMTAISVGRASGVAMLAAANMGVPVVEYSPNQVKLAVTGDGNASKRAVQTMVGRRLGLRMVAEPADAADAVAVALCHLQSLRGAVR
jgi:crossover junction endodeoxyribonuclease RuvC